MNYRTASSPSWTTSNPSKANGWPSVGFFTLLVLQSPSWRVTFTPTHGKPTTHHLATHFTPPWNNWYHITVHAYGSWLRGDPRGWRSLHHREHVDGDYKNPPPKGTYDNLYELSKALMKRDAVRIATELRQFIADAVAQSLQRNSIEVLIISLDARHLHVLARFPDHNPRHWIGLAKKHASHLVRQQGLRTEEGGLWAKRSHAQPIADRQHQLQAFTYILAHSNRGARIWRFDRPRPASDQNR
jgi:REP element-mobilizing transposase RayT